MSPKKQKTQATAPTRVTRRGAAAAAAKKPEPEPAEEEDFSPIIKAALEVKPPADLTEATVEEKAAEIAEAAEAAVAEAAAAAEEAVSGPPEEEE